MITLILATTNYFPGLIQLYCAKLLEAMRNRDYAGYNEMDTPIYEIRERHIKKVLADPEFTGQIREKFMITLKVDEDKYYYLIALLLAFLYHTDHCGHHRSDASLKSLMADKEALDKKDDPDRDQGNTYRLYQFVQRTNHFRLFLVFHGLCL